jgi:hypothetical protein
MSDIGPLGNEIARQLAEHTADDELTAYARESGYDIPAARPPAPNDHVCTPATINGQRVLAAVRLTDGDGLAPNAHIVVCTSSSHVRYATWLITNETGKWVAEHGCYGLPWRDALDNMTNRALLWDGTRDSL